MSGNAWNPWHGCRKCSEGCENCYMYYLDRVRAGRYGGDIYKTGDFDYPIKRDRDGAYKVPSGTMLNVALTSDFFLSDADAWRDDAWGMIAERRDVLFWLLTKRPERIEKCLPYDWGDGWENVIINVSTENQRRADERIPILLSLPLKHRGVVCAPFLEEIHIEKYLETGKIDDVYCGGENYDGARPCDFEWVKVLRGECVFSGVNFHYHETGTHFIKDGKMYHLPNKKVQKQMAERSKMSYHAKPTEYKLYDKMGLPINNK